MNNSGTQNVLTTALNTQIGKPGNREGHPIFSNRCFRASGRSGPTNETHYPGLCPNDFLVIHLKSNKSGFRETG